MTSPPGKGLLDGGLDVVGGRVAFGERSGRGDADDDVGEVLARCLADA